MATIAESATTGTMRGSLLLMPRRLRELRALARVTGNRFTHEQVGNRWFYCVCGDDHWRDWALTLVGIQLPAREQAVADGGAGTEADSHPVGPGAETIESIEQPALADRAVGRG